MQITTLTLKQYRNYAGLSIDFSPGINFITGDNGSGKTNILEAISLTSNLRSFRNISDSEIIQWGSDGYYCSSQIQGGIDRLYEVGCIHQGPATKKRIKIDGREMKSITDYYGRFLTVAFIPSDLQLINGIPELRRRFMDSVISKGDRQYLADLGEFRKILYSRNTLLKSLKEHRAADMSELDVWDQLFAAKASRITTIRRSFFSRLDGIFEDVYRALSGGDDAPQLGYVSSCGDGEVAGIHAMLAACRPRDITLGNTGMGPQRDDFSISNEREINFCNYASQGQRRIAAISLKIAEKAFVEEATGRRAVLLVDDIFSELDAKRRSNMMDVLDQGAQIIMTMTHRDIAGPARRGASQSFHIDRPGSVQAIDG
jgi:DNA replication and repair protein RecF